MHKPVRALTVVSVILTGLCVQDGGAEGETGTQFLKRYEEEALLKLNAAKEAAWQQKSNVTDENKAAYVSRRRCLNKFRHGRKKNENTCFLLHEEKNF